MRIVIARQNHETNTFSPVPTPLAAFRPLYGDAALAEAEGMKTALGAFHAWGKKQGAEISCPLIAHAWPSAPVEDDAFEHMAEVILADVAKGCDVILLDLHGAMVTRSHDDGEGELLARVRAAAPGVPIGVALDLHGNITPQMVKNCDVIAGFKTYPHIDMYETGELVCKMVDQMQTGLRPVMARVQPPLLGHTLPMNTTAPGAMLDVINLARATEAREGVLAVTVFGGFPAADLYEAGASVVAVTTPDLDPEVVAHEIARAIWDRRDEFLYDQKPLEQSIAAARAAAHGPGQGPVLMLDHGDNCMSGGTCENMDVLEAALAAGLSDILTGPVADPEAVEAAFAAGVGTEVSIDVGNKIPAEGFAAPRPPLSLKGKVLALGSGDYRITGPIYTGMECSMGRSAVIDTGAAQVLISSQTHEPWDEAVFTTLGLDPRRAQYLLLKSRMYCRPVFEPLAKAVVECAGGGVTGSDYSLFPYSKLRRPICPLDPGVEWE
ncbi:M81 family metallopeptidase [Rhodobacter sp. 24-YEA-8]|uniref:M81 family metallopeptidase n=1 Tax=Rhodobacter sp. 24-YEA-8 TaxID=1884310 RepID=UPI00089744B8|nr:M81 family metallopeptidase [Rhodobacter sp. 24-YEA-8]SED45960.1 Microcystin degradation protein MlrC, contains DUF1485 domain [Rhodobacter sp. 24-YEA-8]